MNQTDSLERDLTAWFVDSAAPRTPGYVDDILRRTADTRQRPRWTFLERWLPMTAVTTRAAPVRRIPWRTVGLVALLILAIALAAMLVAGSQRRLPAPFGPAANGLMVYSKDGDIFAVDPVAGTRRPIVAGPANDEAPAWSLDGTRLAFHRAASGGSQVVIADADGSHEVIAKGEPFIDLNTFAWSPDGHSIAVTSSIGGVRTISIIDTSDGTVRTLDVGMPAEQAYWRPPDGRDLLFLGRDSPDFGLFLVAPDGSDLREIPLPNGDRTAILPGGWLSNGERFAFHQLTPDHTAYRTHFVDVNGDGEVVIGSSDGDAFSAGFPLLSNDGTRVVFLDGGGPCDCKNWLSVASTSGGPSTRLTPDYPAPYGIGYDWSPDDTRIITSPASGGQTTLLDPNGGPPETPPWVSEGWSSWQRVAP
jgi:Tol biopolymer transport system component